MVLKKQHSNTAFNNKTALPSTRTWDRHRCFVKCSLVFAWNGRGCLTRHHFWTFPPIPFHHYVHEILIVLEQHTPFQISPSIHCFRPVYEIVTVFHDSGPQASKHFFSIASMNELGMVLKRQHRQSAIVVHLSKFPRFAFHQCHRAWPLGDSPAPPTIHDLRMMGVEKSRSQAGKFANLDDSSLPDAALQRVETRFFCIFFGIDE